MKKYYIILSRSKTTVALLVRFFSKKYYSHASLSFDPRLDTFYSFGRKNPLIMLPAGFITEGIDKGYFGVYPKTEIDVLEGELTDEEYDLLQEHLKEFTEKRQRYKYNLLGLPLGFFGIPNERKRHFTCSGFVAYVFRDIFDFGMHYSLVEPEHFYKMNLKSIYKGTAGGYKYEEL